MNQNNLILENKSYYDADQDVTSALCREEWKSPSGEQYVAAATLGDLLGGVSNQGIFFNSNGEENPYAGALVLSMLKSPTTLESYVEQVNKLKEKLSNLPSVPKKDLEELRIVLGFAAINVGMYANYQECMELSGYCCPSVIEDVIKDKNMLAYSKLTNRDPRDLLPERRRQQLLDVA